MCMVLEDARNQISLQQLVQLSVICGHLAVCSLILFASVSSVFTSPAIFTLSNLYFTSLESLYALF